jgi:hypothetical protein
MPHVDEMLGPATLAAASLFAAIALQPAAAPAPTGKPATAVVAEERVSQATVRLPTIEVVGRRGATLAADGRRAAKPRA